ncbi:SGNH/GDSL hydrolase family protein [Kitasatospora kifunensis]|uniref:Lysophospholipase L1-like esterase n=1 Tax=Kitasatospora kifunensis TaxID=58351 RepID=A0A7W7VWS7_KITKI|nr:SGNH/GDSL hydrolase family protein [Kitasatospora kifunensis]MBB4925273.1 lysophospholipase L1-like esterase [Kitasatospora kifunensis]
MKRTIAALLAATLCAGLGLLGSVPAQAAPARRDNPPVLRVMPLGDSITVGVGSQSRAGYRLPLWQLITGQSRYAVEFVGSQRDGSFASPQHEGHSGWMIDDIRDHVDDWLAAQRPDVVLLHIGINDLDRGADKAHAPDRLRALVERIFADRPGVTVILQGLLPTTAGLQTQVYRFNRQAWVLESTERQLGNRLSYVTPPALTEDEWYDRLHPNDRGYARMALAFYDTLDREARHSLDDVPVHETAGRP